MTTKVDTQLNLKKSNFKHHLPNMKNLQSKKNLQSQKFRTNSND